MKSGRRMKKTKNNTKGILNICLNYGGQEEIVDACKKLIDNEKISNFYNHFMYSFHNNK